MLLATIKRRFTFAIMSVLFLAMFFPLTILPDTALAQTNPNQCPQGKLCSLPVASPTTIAHPLTTTNLTVNANQDLPGLDTGIDLAVGNGVIITASGQATFGIGSTQDCNTTEETQPDGQRILSDGTLCPGKVDPSAVLPSSPVGELLANFGASGWFGVGSSDGFTAATSGRLFLLYNDISGQYGNNSGSYQVTVTISTSSALTVTAVYTRDGNGNVSNTFAPGAAIQYVVNVNNSSGNSMNITLHYQAYGPNNNYIYDSTFTATIPQGASGWFVQGTVPNNAPAGTYTALVHVADQNNTQNQGSGQSQFTVSNNKVNNAIAWAKSQLGSTNWNGLCERFVEIAYGTSGQFLTAQDAYNKLHTSTNWSPDIGALVWFVPNKSNGKSGHVGIYLGNDQFISATYNGVQIHDMKKWSKNIATYEGWGDAPSSWPGR